MTHGHSLFKSRWKELLKVFLKLGAMSYGGPAIMGIMQTELQEKRDWLSKERFLEGLALVNMLPGGAVTQLSIFIGYHRAGWLGGALAGFCFILPSFCIILTLTMLYSAYGALPVMRDVFYGLGPIVLGIFVVVLYRLGKVALTGVAEVGVAIVAAILVEFTPVGIIGILLLAGCAGVALHHSRTWGLRAALAMALLIGGWHWADVALNAPGPAAGHIPVAGDTEPGLLSIGTFFLSVGAFTFGGGLTVIAFVQDQVVNQLHWLTPREFLDGIALGQLTPGPILMLAAYVGYKLSGIPGALVGWLAIYLPSFALMLSILPVLQRFRELDWLKAAMKTIAAAVTGVISVSLMHMAPHAVPDAYTMALLALTVAAMLIYSLQPLPLMLAGALAGIGSRLRPFQRLKELV